MISNPTLWIIVVEILWKQINDVFVSVFSRLECYYYWMIDSFMFWQTGTKKVMRSCVILAIEETQTVGEDQVWFRWARNLIVTIGSVPRKRWSCGKESFCLRRPQHLLRLRVEEILYLWIVIKCCYYLYSPFVDNIMKWRSKECMPRVLRIHLPPLMIPDSTDISVDLHFRNLIVVGPQ